MRVVVAALEFKGTLTAVEATAAMAKGILGALPSAEVSEKPMADGGRGTLDAFRTVFTLRERVTSVRGPLGEPVDARWALLPDGSAVIETAQAVGLSLVPPAARDPLAASSFGAGQLMRAALDSGARLMFVGLGGSATSDGGRGLLEALGASFDEQSGVLDVSRLDRRLVDVDLVALLDVRNRLLGPNGASRVYGPQKGASPAEVDLLERRMARFAHSAESAFGRSARALQGAGAAGGLGFALMLLGAQALSGAETIARITRVEEALDGADALFTGEGSYDAQTAAGKGVHVLTELASARQVPVYGIFGDISGTEPSLEDALSLVELAGSPEQAMGRARELVVEAAGRMAGRLSLSS